MELFWGIPFIGGTLILTFAWLPLIGMFVLHVVTLIFSVKEEKTYHGSILGIVTSCIGWIPIVGMTMHIVSGILLLIDAFQSQKDKI